MNEEYYVDPNSRMNYSLDGLRAALTSELQALDRYILAPGAETHQAWRDRAMTTHQMHRSVLEAHLDRIVSIVDQARIEVLEVKEELASLRTDIAAIKKGIQANASS